MPTSRASRSVEDPERSRSATSAAVRSGSPASPQAPQPGIPAILRHSEEAAGRITADEWWEESNRQAAELKRAPAEGPSLFAEFRRKLATGEALARSLVRLAQALRFTGRLTVTFHQGRVTRTICEESHFSGGDS